MTDRGPLFDHNEAPEDVATLYSWANLHGAKYRDFSEARAQTREKARLRMQQAVEEEQARAQQQAQSDRTMEAQHAAEAARMEEENRQTEQSPQAQRATHEELEAAAQQALREAAHRWAQEPVDMPVADVPAHEQQQDSVPPPVQNVHRGSWPQPLAERFASFAVPEPPPAQPPAAQPPKNVQIPPPQKDYPDTPEYTAAPPQGPVINQPQQAPMREETSMPPRNLWGQVDLRETTSRPAWLTERTEPAGQPASPRASQDTLQGSRERLASRWYALRGVFEGATAPPETAPAAPPARAPVVAVFSLAGGVGKTSLVATLGRALSARGERVLLVDTAAYGLMPFFFGAHDQRPGVLRTFSPPGTSGDAPIQMVTLDPESLGPETGAQEALSGEIGKYSRGANRVIVDLATASGATSRRVMKMAPLVLVPMIPDLNSVVSVSSIDSFFQHNQQSGSSTIKASLPYYVLNQFDPSLPLHLDLREVLREQLGERLLPFVLHRNPAVGEALAEGMTVMDYAPNSSVAEDFGSLAGWVKNQSAPASSAYRGVRWSER